MLHPCITFLPPVSIHPCWAMRALPLEGGGEWYTNQQPSRQTAVVVLSES